jgi:peroxiredoxin
MCALPVAADEPPRTKAPSFKGTDVNGAKVSLGDLLGKGPVVIDFWATWCKPCVKELPYLQRMHEQYAARGLEVVAVTIDSPKSQSQVKKFVATRGYTFRVLLDGDQAIFKKLQGRGSIPYVVVLDREGTIHYQHTGYRPGDEKKLEDLVVQLLGGETAEPPSAPANPGEEGTAPAGEFEAEG